MTLHERTTDRRFCNDKNESVFLYGNHLHCTLHLDPSADAAVTVLTIGASVLRRLIGQKLFQTILGGLNLTDQSAAVSAQIPPDVSSHLHASVAGGLRGHEDADGLPEHAFEMVVHGFDGHVIAAGKLEKRWQFALHRMKFIIELLHLFRSPAPTPGGHMEAGVVQRRGQRRLHKSQNFRESSIRAV